MISYSPLHLAAQRNLAGVSTASSTVPALYTNPHQGTHSPWPAPSVSDHCHMIVKHPTEWQKQWFLITDFIKCVFFKRTIPDEKVSK